MISLSEKNNLSLYILDELLVKHQEVCKQLPSHQSLIGIFFHDLVIYLTSSLLIKLDNVSEGDISFPFTSQTYLHSPHLLNFNKHQVQRNKLNLNLPFGRQIGFARNIPFDSAWDKLNIIARNRHISLHQNEFLFASQNDQLALIRETLVHLCTKYELSKMPDIYAENFISYCKSFLSDKEVYTEVDFILKGSNVSVYNRLLSAQQIKHGKRSICVGHGEQSPFFLDEPVFFYGDLSYTSDFISYGHALPDSHFSVKYRLTDEMPKIWNRSSQKILSLVNQKWKKSVTPKILYIPTSYSSNKRYGPYRDICDRDYVEWQKKIMEGKHDITIKIHPKGAKVNIKWKFESRQLEDCILDYDYYILDYVSTGSSLALGTQRPVLFLDLGIRNISADAIDLLKRSCKYHKLGETSTVNEVNSLITDFVASAEGSQRENLLENYFITKDNTKTTGQVIQDILSYHNQP